MSVAKRKYWFLPVGLIFRHPFDAMPWAKTNESSMLMLLAETDATVPHEHSQKLFKAWKGPKKQITFKDCDHSSIVRHSDFFATIAEHFISHEIHLAKESSVLEKLNGSLQQEAVSLGSRE